MENNINKPVNEFEDILFVAFLEYRGHTVTPYKQPNGLVFFEIIGDISRDIEAFHLNQQVSVRDYSNTIKNLERRIKNIKK
jgi:hypothetical protein